MNAGFSEEKIISYTKSIMEQYVEETAAPQNNKIDHYVIGGRWSGALGALKGAKSDMVSIFCCLMPMLIQMETGMMKMKNGMNCNRMASVSWSLSCGQDRI